MRVALSSREATSLDVTAVMERLHVTSSGLTETEAHSRLAQYGPNIIAEKRTHPFIKFLKNFWGPIPWMIEVALILSLAVRDWKDFILIFLLLLVNGVIRFWEENKADNAIAMLKKALALKATVKREGQWIELNAAEIVPGDLILLKLGDIAPADVKIIKATNAEMDQAALTGESLPVEKKENDLAYSSAILRRGEIQGIVIGTGGHTLFGKTASLVKAATTRNHFQQAVLRIGRFLIVTTMILISIILIFSLFRHDPIVETIQFLLILTVAAIPVALPAVLSVTMAVGATQLSKLKAIVSRLVSIEELASMDILCSDKTGTLTENKLQIGEPIPIAKVSAEEILQAAALTCDSIHPDAIDQAILKKYKIDPEKKPNITAYIPFDPVTKRSEATIDENGKNYAVSKGAAQVILTLCENLDKATRDLVEKKVEELALKGYRTLAVAKKMNSAWIFMGLLTLSDPPRPDSRETILAAKNLGIDIKMLTGDHLAIAKELSHEIGLSSNIIEINQLVNQEHFDPKEIEKAGGFAQVFPEHKFKIVCALQKLGHIVGMTGDGVNDAPALKQADAGIAVQGATDAARSAADLVLTAPGLSVIISAIKKARQIFYRMNAYAIYRIAETMRVLFFMSLAILIFNFYPLTAVMIIVLALLNDIPIMTIAYDHARISQHPVRWDMHKVLVIASALGTFGVLSSFLLFWIARDVMDLSNATLQTLMFLKLTASGHMTIYLSRTGQKPFFTKPWPSPILFFTTETTQVLGTLFAVYGWLMPAIGWKLALFVWAYSILEFLCNDVVKMSAYHLTKKLRDRLYA